MNILSSIVALSCLVAIQANTYFVVKTFPNSANCDGTFFLTAISLGVCIPSSDVPMNLASAISKPFVILSVNTSSTNPTVLQLSGFANPNCETPQADASVPLELQCNSSQPSSIEYFSNTVPTIPQSYFVEEQFAVSVNACSENPDILKLTPLDVCITNFNNSLKFTSNGTTIIKNEFESDECGGIPVPGSTSAVLPCTVEIADDNDFFTFFTTSSVTLPTESSSSSSSSGVGAAAFGVACALVLLMVMIFTIWYNWIHLKTLVCGIETATDDQQFVAVTRTSSRLSRASATRLSTTKEKELAARTSTASELRESLLS